MKDFRPTKCPYNRFFYINPRSLEKTTGIFKDDPYTAIRGVNQLTKRLQCKICYRVFHKLFGLNFHLKKDHAGEIDQVQLANFAPRKKVKRPARKAKNNARRRRYAWEESDTTDDESSGEVILDDESDEELVLLSDDDDEDDSEVEQVDEVINKRVDSSVQTFDAETLKVLESYVELQPDVLIKDLYQFPEETQGYDLPDLSTLSNMCAKIEPNIPTTPEKKKPSPLKTLEKTPLKKLKTNTPQKINLSLKFYISESETSDSDIEFLPEEEKEEAQKNTHKLQPGVADLYKQKMKMERMLLKRDWENSDSSETELDEPLEKPNPKVAQVRSSPKKPKRTAVQEEKEEEIICLD